MVAPEHAAARIGMPLDEFIQQFDDAPFELINGERRAVMPTVAGHSAIIAFLLRLLFSIEASAQIAVYSEGTFVLLEEPNWVKGSRVPDIMVYAAERLAAYKAVHPDWRETPFRIVPDLCVEVVSRNDKMADVMDKVEAYLRDGVRLIWVFEPGTRTVTIREAGSQQAMILYASDVLTGGAIVAGFSAKVGEIFGE